MKINIGNGCINVEYKINEEKRTVVCILTTINDVQRRLNKYGLGDDDLDEIDDIRIYKGVAKCSPEDEWNEVYGMRLAEYRANKMRMADVNNELRKWIKGMVNSVDNLAKYGLIKEPPLPKMPSPYDINKNKIWDD